MKSRTRGMCVCVADMRGERELKRGRGLKGMKLRRWCLVSICF